MFSYVTWRKIASYEAGEMRPAKREVPRLLQRSFRVTWLT